MICTVCGAVDRHVAASCPKRPGPRWYDAAICTVFAVVVMYNWVRLTLA